MINGESLIATIEANVPRDPHFAFLREIEGWSRDDVRSTGFVIDTFDAALWCALNTDSYADCVLAAVNLGDDTDTTACVAGALAGAMYGYDSIYKAGLSSFVAKK